MDLLGGIGLVQHRIGIIRASLKPPGFISQSIRLRWAGHVVWKEGNSFNILVGKPIGKRPLGISRHRWEENIRIDLKEIGINKGNWIN